SRRLKRRFTTGGDLRRGSSMSSSIAIRRPRATDEAAWRALWEGLVATGPEPCSAEAPAAVWRRVLTPGDPMALWLAVDADDRPVGFVLSVVFPYSWSTRPVCYLLDLYVAPAQ